MNKVIHIQDNSENIHRTQVLPVTYIIGFDDVRIVVEVKGNIPDIWRELGKRVARSV